MLIFYKKIFSILGVEILKFKKINKKKQVVNEIEIIEKINNLESNKN